MKSDNEIYNEVKEFIETKATKEQLINMLVEAIDNFTDDVYKNIYIDHIQNPKA